MQLEQTSGEFQAKIIKLAVLANKTPQAVYGLWHKYSKQCEWSDQSAILWEFVQWYQKDLGDDQSKLQEAIS